MVSNEFNSEFKPCSPPEQHKAITTLLMKIKIFGFAVYDIDMILEQTGAATTVFKIKIPFSKILIMHLLLIPIQSRKYRTIFHIYSEPTFIGKFISQLFIYEMTSHFTTSDAIIWCNKKYLKSPVLHKSDKSIVTCRRWYSQFYSESSYKLHHVIES